MNEMNYLINIPEGKGSRGYMILNYIVFWDSNATPHTSGLTHGGVQKSTTPQVETQTTN